MSNANTTNDNAFVRGIKRAVEQRKRMQREQAAEHSAPAPAVNTDHCQLSAAALSAEQCSANAEQYRLNLLNTIIKHIRKNRKESTQ
ncbi:hypothetical protein [Pseudomonas soli]|uniref:hypothetical protein n=1 Tax=Pseudomonas soli TaxID=1306993 RepID=UPI00345CEDC3